MRVTSLTSARRWSPVPNFPVCVGFVIALACFACSRPRPNASSDVVSLEQWRDVRPKSPAEAVAEGERDGIDRLGCPLGLVSGTCDAFSFVTLSGGYTGRTYYFDGSGLVGVDTTSDVPTPPTKFGLVPKCMRSVVTKHVCTSD